MARLFDMAKMTVSGTPGAGTITLGSAVSGFQTFSDAGVTDGLTVSYSILDGSNWEVGRGVYTVSGTTLSRGPLFSSNSNSAVSLTSAAIVWITILCEDLIQTVTLAGNTAGSTNPIISPDLELVGGQSITLSGTSNSISIIGGTSNTAQNRLANGNSFGQSSSAVGTLTNLGISATGGISAGFSTDASSAVLMLSVAPPIASGTIGNFFASGNTTALSSSSTHTLSNVSVSGAGIVSVGVSTTAAGAGILVISASTAATNPLLSIFAVGNTTSSVSSGANAAGSLSFDGAGIVSVGISNSSVVISASTAATNPVLSVFAVGNTTSSVSSGVIAAGSLSFDGAGIVSVGVSNSSVVISAPSPAASGTVGNYFASGNTTALSSSSTHTLSNVSISGAGIVSVGVSTTGAAAGILVISASTAATNPLLSLFAVGNTTSSVSSGANAAGSLSFDGAGIVSVGISNSSIVISASTAATNPLISIFAVGNTTSSVSSGVIAAGSLSFDGAGIVSVGVSNSSVVISAPAPNLSLFAIGNTTGAASSTSSVLPEALSFSGSGAISVGYSSNTIIIAGATVAAGAQSLFAVGNTTSSVSSGVAGAGSLSFDAVGALSVGVSNSSIVLSTPNVSTLLGVSGITLSTNVNTISIGEQALSFLEPREWQGTTTSTWPLGTMALVPFTINKPITINQANFFSSRAVLAPAMTLSSSSASRTVSATASWGSTASFVLYSQQDATSFSSLSSTTASFGLSAVLSASFSSSSKTGSQTVTFGWPQGTSAAVTSSMSTTFSTVSASVATQVMHTSSSLFANWLRNDFPFAASFPPGEYVIGVMWSSGQGSTTLSTGLVTMNPPTWLATNGVLTMGPGTSVVGVPGAVLSNLFPGIGSTSSAGSAVPPSIAWQSISSAASHPANYFYLNNG